MHVNVKYKNGTKFHSWINANRPFRNRALVQRLIHLFSLYVLFSQCRSYDNTLEDCFFQIFPHSRAYVSIMMKKTKGEIPPEVHRENKTYQPKRSINNAACCLEIEARGKLQQSDKKVTESSIFLQRTASNIPCYSSRLFSHLVPKHWCMGTGPKYFVVTTWLGTRYVTVCIFALFYLFRGQF